MQRLLKKIIHNFSRHHRQRFFYNRENEKFRQNIDSVRARAAFESC